MPQFGTGNIIEWFNTEESYEKRLKELRYTLSDIQWG